jgi:hypothetical protein
LTTAAGDQLAGLLEDSVFFISSAENAKPQIQREAVASVVFGQAAPPLGKANLRFRLRSGDTLIGELSHDLRLLPGDAAQPVVITLAELRSFRIPGKPGKSRLNGRANR